MATVDAVIVSYNSREHLRLSVSSVLALAGAGVVVVDNASADGSPDVVEDLPIDVVRLESNRGFAAGCNVGWRDGTAPYVLFLNPDATIDATSLGTLVSVLDRDERIGIVAPRLLDDDGSLTLSQRRFPRTRTVLAQALFLHRLIPDASWADDVVHDRRAYATARSTEWLPGACLLVRRVILEQLAGFDETFFHYCEDMDLCRRAHDLGYDVRYEPGADCIHIGGQSAPRTSLLPRRTASKLRYAAIHRTRAGYESERAALALYALTHAVLSSGGSAARKGHREAFVVAVRGSIGDGSPARTARSGADEPVLSQDGRTDRVS